MLRRLLIVRLGAMGDVIHALPAVAALRLALPAAEIGWAIERRWSPLVVADESPLAGPRSPQRPLLDRVHIVNTRAWRNAPLSDETWSEMRNVISGMRAQNYELAIDFQGAWKSAILAQLAHAHSRIGFAQPREKPATMFYTRVVPARGTHVIDQNFSLVERVCQAERECHPERGRKSESRDLLFPLRAPACSAVTDFPLRSFASLAVNAFPSDPAAEQSVANKLGTTSRFAILNPGAGWPAKQWPAARYAELARALADDGISPLINHGPGEESLAREVESASGGAGRPIFCTLAELIALTRRAALFVGGDTGPMHLAVALGIPVVALFGPTDPARNGPYDFTTRTTVLAAQAKIENQKAKMFIVLRHPSSHTSLSHSAGPDPGLLQISAADVLQSCRELLLPRETSA